MGWKIRKGDGTQVNLREGEFLTKDIFVGGVYVGKTDLGTWIQWERGEITDDELLGALFECDIVDTIKYDDGYEIWAE